MKSSVVPFLVTKMPPRKKGINLSTIRLSVTSGGRKREYPIWHRVIPYWQSSQDAKMARCVCYGGLLPIEAGAAALFHHRTNVGFLNQVQIPSDGQFQDAGGNSKIDGFLIAEFVQQAMH